MRVLVTTIGLLTLSNVFMTFAWYAHLRNLAGKPWYIAAVISWGIAFFEYMLQVPANRIGHTAYDLSKLVSPDRLRPARARGMGSRRAHASPPPPVEARHMIPGRALHHLASLICSTKSLERIVEPAIADLQKEYDRHAASHFLRCLWMLFRGYSAILKVMAVCALGVSVATDEERNGLVRTFAWSLAFMIAAVAMLMLPPLWLSEPGFGSTRHLIQLIPQAVPLAIPVGLAFGIAFGLAGCAVTRAMAKTILLVAVAASLVSFAMLAWVMPAANQAFRTEWSHSQGYEGTPRKGSNEMTISELRREIEVAAALGDARNVHQHSWFLHLRYALSLATVVLGGFLLALRGRGRAMRTLVAFITCGSYWVLLVSGEALSGYDRHLSEIAAAWLPNVVLLTVTLFIVSSRRRGFLTARGQG